MADSRRNNLEEYKIKASILAKALKSDNSEEALRAAARFRCLPQMTRLTALQILAQKEDIKRKHALQVIALENRHESWTKLKQSIERREELSTRWATPLYPARCFGFSNEWYADYETARSHLEQVGGYLLPYRDQYFICKRQFIETLGLDPDDADWQRIAWDWAKPADSEAWQRLNTKLQAIEQR